MQIFVGILVGAIVPAIGWIVNHRLQTARLAEQRLHDSRRKLYREILSPYIRVFYALGVTQENTDRQESIAEANGLLSSIEHRERVFELMMVGSDDVISSFNRLARFMIEVKNGDIVEQPGDLLSLWSELVLAIRKDLGEPATELSASAMIESWVSDMNTVYPKYQSGLSTYMKSRHA